MSPGVDFPRVWVWVGGWLIVLQSRLWGALVIYFSFQNDVSEKEQRWGAKTVQGSGHQEHIK